MDGNKSTPQSETATVRDLGAHGANLTNDEYRLLNGLTSTELRLFLQAPIKYKNPPSYNHSSTARTIGLLAHMVFSGDSKLEETYGEMQHTDGRFKEAKEEKRLALERGIELLKPEVWHAGTRSGIAAAELLGKWLRRVVLPAGEEDYSVDYEVPLVALHAPSQQVIKSRPDALVRTSSGIWIVDLKTTSDATVRGFGRQARSQGYITQLAHYAEVQAAHDPDLPILGAVIVAVETSTPYAGAVHYIDPEALLMERQRCEQTYAEVYGAREEGVFPNILPGTLYGDSEAVQALDPDARVRRALHLVANGVPGTKAAKLCDISLHKLRYRLRRNKTTIF